MNEPHTKVIESINGGKTVLAANGATKSTYVFEILEEDIADLNLVSIANKRYPVYKDHNGYYIIMYGKRVSNGDLIYA